ncbi:MAG: hypothetical protein ACK5C8_12560 [Roseiflexaceae bacterium]|nr:hypothetical protein [Chloroflexaceae bacterium]MCE2853494.1 hypothetical protein [Chloroflexaceae bacterium]
MTDSTIVDALIGYVQKAPAHSGKRQRHIRWWFFFAVALVSFATGVAGFIGALQTERTRIASILLFVFVVVLIIIRIIVMRRPAPLLRWHPLSMVQPQASWLTTLMHAAHTTRWQQLVGRGIRIGDFVMWVLMALVLVAAAGIIFTFSAFGLYDGLKTGLDYFDVVLFMGLVGPFMSVRSGIARWRARRDGSRKRLNSFTETLRNALGAVNNFFHTTLDSTAGMVRAGVTNVTSTVSTSVVSLTTTAALATTVAGVGLAAVDVAPRSIIATGRVVPLPMEVALLAGEDGRNVGLRGEILLNCMDDIMSDTDRSDAPCQNAVHQVSELCAQWNGKDMPPGCEANIFALLPEIQPLVQNGENNDPRDNRPYMPPPTKVIPPTHTRGVVTPTPLLVTDTRVSDATTIPTQTDVPLPSATAVVETTPVVEPVIPPNMTQMPEQGGNAAQTPIVRLPNNNAQGTPLDTPLPGTDSQP